MGLLSEIRGPTVREGIYSQVNIYAALTLGPRTKPIENPQSKFANP